MGYGGLAKSGERTNGFLLKTGIKFPLKFQSLYSIMYFMPQFAYSHYTILSYDYSISTNSTVTVSAQAIMLGFGYRHIMPASKFFYDVGFGIGYGWANNSNATNNFNHLLTGRTKITI